MDQEYIRFFNEYKLPLKAEPFICQEDVDAAFECLEVSANPKSSILVAKIAYNTGASLNDILNIQSSRFYCSKSGRTFDMPVPELYNLVSNDNFYFSSKGKAPNHSKISSSFSTSSKSFGYNLSFLRFFRTFYYKRYLEEKSVEGVPLYIGMNTLKICENIGVTLEFFNTLPCLPVTWDYSVEKYYVFVVGRSEAAELIANRIFSGILDGTSNYRHLVLVDTIEDSQTRLKFKSYRKSHVSYESLRFDLLDIFDRFLPTTRSGAILYYDESMEINLPGYLNIEKISIPSSDPSYQWKNLLNYGVSHE